MRGPIPELDLRAAEKGALPPAEMQEARFARCPNCGAQVELGLDEHARECPFCATPIVTDTGPSAADQAAGAAALPAERGEGAGGDERLAGPALVRPLAISRQYARAGRAMQGIYVPYWTYDAETRTEYAGQRGTVYYETRPVTVVVNGRRQTTMQQVARIRWQPVRGRVARDFDDVLVLGSTSLPKRFTDALAPWDLSALTAYEPKFLAGFRAEGYTVPVEDGYQEARAIMNAVIERDVRADIGGDQQRIDQLRTEVGDLTFKHVLLPVWLAAYRYRRQELPLRGQRPHRQRRGRAAVLGGQDRHRRRHRAGRRRRSSPTCRSQGTTDARAAPPGFATLAALLARRPAAADEPPPALIEATESGLGPLRGARAARRGSSPSYEAARDLNGDGRPDFVTDLAGLECAGAWDALCSGARLPGQRLALGARRRPRPLRPRPAARLLDRGGRGRRPPRASSPCYDVANCGPDADRRLHPHLALQLERARHPAHRRAAAAAPEPRRSPPPPPEAPALAGWTLRRVPGASPVALGAGPGNLSSLAAFCLEGQPFLALTFHDRAAERERRARLRLQPGPLDVTAGFESTAGGAYVVALADAPLAARLAGRDSEVEVERRRPSPRASFRSPARPRRCAARSRTATSF